jgi:hypothetical protein
MKPQEVRFEVRERDLGHGTTWPTIIRPLLTLCAVGAITLLLVAESRLSSERRQQSFEALGVYP